MLVTELYDGQGLGNQLWSYVVTRTLALDKGLEFGIMNPSKFKGASFLSLDFGKELIGGSGPEGGPPLELPIGVNHYFVEKDVWYAKYKCDIRDFDPNLLEIKENTKIEGYFQSEKLILHRKNEIRSWLKVNSEFECSEFSNDNVCIMNIRGGEYKGNSDLILPKKYWTDAVANMRRLNSKLDFIIITDDVEYTKRLLPKFPSYHFNIGKDYSIINNAKYLVLSNSSFAFFPAWTSEVIKYVIAPKYWARHNISNGFWACQFNMYQSWKWQDREGKLFDYAECETEFESYKLKNNLHLLQSRPPLKLYTFSERALIRVNNVASRLKHELFGY